jgi:hypothetical protein
MKIELTLKLSRVEIVLDSINERQMSARHLGPSDFCKNEKQASTVIRFKLRKLGDQIFGSKGRLLAHALHLPPID